MSAIKVPFTRALTVLLTRDVPIAQAAADSDLQAIRGGSQVIAHPSNEAYFHRLRLRVAENPELAKQIAVFYCDHQGIISEIKLGFKDELHWPVGFASELWDEEVEIIKARYTRGESPVRPRKSFGEIRQLFAKKHPKESLFFEQWLKEMDENGSLHD